MAAEHVANAAPADAAVEDPGYAPELKRTLGHRVAGLLFLIALTAAIKDIPAVSASASPVAAIIHDQLGPVMERVLLAGLVFALFGAGMVVMAACSRQVFAMARDECFLAHRLLRRVNPRTKTPILATILIVVVGVVLMVALPGEALLQLIIGGTVLPALIYGAIVVLYLAVRKRLERREGGFSLGRFEVPVAISALIWVAFALFVLVTPHDAFVRRAIPHRLITAPPRRDETATYPITLVRQGVVPRSVDVAIRRRPRPRLTARSTTHPPRPAARHA